MSSKSFKFMCTSVGILALGKFTIGLYNVIATLYINSLPQSQEEEKTIGFKED